MMTELLDHLGARHVPLDVDLLRECLDYNSTSGVLQWKVRPARTFTSSGRYSADRCAAAFNARMAGMPALAAPHGQYARGIVNGIPYFAHRVAYALGYGVDPGLDEIDHINGDGRDNRLCNLRRVSRSDNMRNRPRQKNNSSGTVGISLNRRLKKWRAYLGRFGRKGYVDLGYFADFAAAAAARDQAERALGYHPNHGRVQ